jgi:hypothetical protein
MTRKWILSLAVLVSLTGCKSSDQTANQANAADASGSANQATAGQQTAERKAEARRELVVPAGTSISVILSSSVSAAQNQPGDEFQASIASPVLVDGRVAIPKGASANGTVVSAQKQGAIKGAGALSIRLTNVEVGGKNYSVTTNPYGASVKGKGKRTAEFAGGGAAVGALIGGLAGHGKGAAIGAAVGGGGGLAAGAGTGGQKLEFPAESRITFTLAESVTIER